jgi:hypothetical protein
LVRSISTEDAISEPRTVRWIRKELPNEDPRRKTLIKSIAETATSLKK